MPEATSQWIRENNGPGQIANLKAAGYMSPQDSTFQNHGFSCGNCDWFGYAKSFCVKPEIRANIEYNGCCNLFTHNGVHT